MNASSLYDYFTEGGFYVQKKNFHPMFDDRVAENSIGPRHNFLQCYKSDFFKSFINMKILYKTNGFLQLSFNIIETKSSYIKRIRD